MRATDDQSPTAKDWRCSKCDPEYKPDPNGPGEDAERKARNCDGITSELFFPWDPDLKQCPNAYITAQAWAMVEWWQDWKTFGALPYRRRGDLLDQPAFVVQVFRRCEQTMVQIDMEKNKAERDKAERERKAALMASSMR